MNLDEIKKHIKDGESGSVEFKENFDNETVETVGAFSNSKGGIILLGVSDSKKTKGIQIGKETIRGWINQISLSTEPRVIPGIEQGKLDKKDVVAIYVKEFPIKPVSVKGKCFKRVGNSNRVMTPQEITQLHIYSTGQSFDAFPVPNASVADIDKEKIKEYVRMANKTGRRKIKESENPLKILEKLELIKNGRPTIASIILFGKSPQDKFSQATAHCGKFRQETIIVDDKMIRGTLIDQVEGVMDFFRKNTNVRFAITGKPKRDEIWDYPLDALREAAINAICHRDYADNSDIQIKIHDDRLTIWNPGGLLPGMTIDELYDPNHSSKLRNKLIGQTFYDIELIEKYGSGIQRIIEACTVAGLPIPSFEERFGGFLVIFRKDIYTDEYLIRLGLNERQIQAVRYVKEKGKITNKKYQSVCETSQRTATRDLASLVSSKVFVQVGATGRGTEYILRRHEDAKGATKAP